MAFRMVLLFQNTKIDNIKTNYNLCQTLPNIFYYGEIFKNLFFYEKVL